MAIQPCPSCPGVLLEPLFPPLHSWRSCPGRRGTRGHFDMTSDSMQGSHCPLCRSSFHYLVCKHSCENNPDPSSIASMTGGGCTNVDDVDSCDPVRTAAPASGAAGFVEQSSALLTFSTIVSWLQMNALHAVQLGWGKVESLFYFGQTSAQSHPPPE